MRIKIFIKHEFVSTYEFISSIIFAFPRHKLFNLLKSNWIRIQGGKVGKWVTFYPGIKINPANNIVIGDHVDLAWGVVVTTGGGVEIGDRSLIGYNTMIFSANHVIPEMNETIFSSGHDYKKVTIDTDVWIGAGCIILPGINVGKGAIVAGGSVLTKDVEPFSIVGGVPAKLLRMRN